jgi:hypothetical protein
MFLTICSGTLANYALFSEYDIKFHNDEKQTCKKKSV